ncbi:MAG TPA: LPS export ABC transporter permease LptG [Burkholderiaceae bacterium]|nr:LPS export ABC transporter permease LptG [Burkholderiaceae bacterium]
MKTVRRLLYRDIVSSVVFVALAFLSLFFFIDFVDELGAVGSREGYSALNAAFASLMELPGHLYELAPISVLIGSIFSLARMAQSSEYTILRTGGLGPVRAIALLTVLGLAFAVCTFVAGDYLAPAMEKEAVLLKARFKGGLNLGTAGAWLKDRKRTAEGERSYSVNVASANPDGTLMGIRVFEFDGDGRLVSRIASATGRVGKDAVWHLDDVTVTHWPVNGVSDQARVEEQHLPRLDWASGLTAGVVAAALLPVNTMSTVDLWRYASHLSQQEQAAQRYAIQFWKKALYPFACLVMIGLALPFAYLHARSGGISLKVFGGILLGISFVLLNNVAGHLGVLHGWTPWLVAAAPSVLYMVMSLAAFAWLVRYR